MTVTGIVLLSLRPLVQFFQRLDAEIRIKGGLSVKRVVLPMGGAFVIGILFGKAVWVLEELCGIDRELAVSVVGIPLWIPLMLLNITIATRKTSEFVY